MALVAAAAVVAIPLTAGAQSAHRTARSVATVQSHRVGRFGEVVTTSSGWSLYVLSTESKGTLHCRSASCTASWPPYTVVRNARLTRGTGVRGTLGHVARGSRWQVTYNGWPLYRFAGDSGHEQSNGERIVAFGGTWYLVHAGATSNAGSPVKSAAARSGGTTTTTSGAPTTMTGW